MLRRLGQLFIIHSFRRKIMAVSVACILLPALLTLLIYNSLTQSAIKRQAVAHSQESLKLVSEYVSNQLRAMLSIANYIQVNPDMSAFFKERVAASKTLATEDLYERFQQEQRIRQQLDTLETVRGDSFFEFGSGLEYDISYVTVLLTNGDYFMTYSVDEFYPPDFAKEPWFEELKTKRGLQSYWVPSSPTVFRQAKSTHPYQISVAQTLSGGPNVYGYVIVTFMEDRLSRIFYNNANIGEVMILDASHRILSSKDVSKIGEEFPYLKEAGSEPSSEIISIDGTRYLVTQQLLPMTGWRLVSKQAYKDAVANIQPIFNRMFLLQLISFLVFLALLLVLLRRFTQPLIQLGRTALTVQRGNLTVRSGVRGQDEIGRLGHSFDQMLEKVGEMIEEVSVTHERKRKAELAMLQAQIKPHFLFNVLNSIRMKVMLRGDLESAGMIQSLTKLLRMTISRDQDLIPLHEEIELITDYANLMNMRQRETAVLDIAVSPDTLMIEVPRFCLQPLIENAMIHGLDRRGGKIRIEAAIQDNVLHLSVEDNGTGMSEDQVKQLKRKFAAGFDLEAAEASGPGSFTGLGLPNVYERMRMTFGERFRMEIRSEPGRGSRFLMLIPLEEG